MSEREEAEIIVDPHEMAEVGDEAVSASPPEVEEARVGCGLKGDDTEADLGRCT